MITYIIPAPCWGSSQLLKLGSCRTSLDVVHLHSNRSSMLVLHVGYPWWAGSNPSCHRFSGWCSPMPEHIKDSGFKAYTFIDAKVDVSTHSSTSLLLYLLTYIRPPSESSLHLPPVLCSSLLYEARVRLLKRVSQCLLTNSSNCSSTSQVNYTRLHSRSSNSIRRFWDWIHNREWRDQNNENSH